MKHGTIVLPFPMALYTQAKEKAKVMVREYIKFFFILSAFVLFSNGYATGAVYTIDGEFDGCEGKVYPLMSGQYLRCDSDKYFYTYGPEVVTDGQRVITIDGQAVEGMILNGTTVYVVNEEFDGCKYGKIYPLTNGQYLRCDSDKYFYEYKPKVVTDGGKVIAIAGQEVRGVILDGRIISTQIEGDWEGCNWDIHKLTNGMYLGCDRYFYEYAFMPRVEIIVIDGLIWRVLIRDSIKSGVSVVTEYGERVWGLPD